LPEPLPVVRLHVLGSVRLDAEGASPRRSVSAQPRRLALLAWLALHSRRGAERRDSLLAVFWPESDTNHARGALRNALHHLRAAVGPDVILSHGSDEVLLDSSRLWCDAVEFERLCDAGDHEAALRLYGGDLLDGFFISDAPVFEHWLDAERQRLRQRAAEAARALADAADDRGEPQLAMLRTRELLKLVPTDEVAARRLMQLLAAADDRGEALRVFSSLEQRLDEEYGLSPSPDTRALADGIRRAPAAAGADASSAKAAGEQLPTPEARSRASRRARRWPSRSLLFAGVASAVLVSVAVAVLLSPPGAADTSGDVVAVMPFEYRGSPDHAYLGEGLADLLATNLNGVGELRAVDPRALMARLHDATLPIPPEHARREAAAHGAGLFVLGSVTEAAGQLRITATVYGPPRFGGSVEDVVVEGRVDDVLTLVDRLTLGLLQRRGPTTVARAAVRTTASVEALKAFLRGEAALRRYAVQDAMEHYRTATQIDSTFALAHYRLSSAAYRWGISGVPAPAAAAALRHAPRLAREDSLLVAAWFHHVNARVALAHRYYTEALHNRSAHVEAAFQLGELLFHWGSAIGMPTAGAYGPFSRVLDAEPHNVEAALHLARLAAREGRVDALDSLITRMQAAAAHETWLQELKLLRAFLTDDEAAQRKAIEAAGGNADWMLEQAAAHTHNLAAIERFVTARLRLEREPGSQARTQLFLTHLRLGLGRYRDALRGIDEATALPAPRRAEYRAMMAGLPFRPMSNDELLAVRAATADYPDTPLGIDGAPTNTRGIEYPHVLWPGMFRERRLYLLALLHARAGNSVAAEAVADTLAGAVRDESFAERYERIVRAQLTAQRGQPDAALRTLGLPADPMLGTFENFVDHGRPYERWLRAELLRESGRGAEALRWYATFPDPMARDLAFLAPSLLRRAGMHDAAGNPALAAEHYTRFVALWSEADAELQPMVEQARQRLREIGGR
jgi:DNA-binding SARP family transcriptional activator/TolB-like protein